MTTNDQPTNPQPPVQGEPAPATDAQPRPNVLPEHRKYAPRPAAQEPAEQQQEPSEPESTEAGADYVLEMPGDIPAAKIGDWEPVLDGFGDAASAAGVPHGVAQQLVEAFVDADSAIGGYKGDYSVDDAEKTLRG